MAMRPEIKRQGWLIIGFAIAQCLLLQASVRHEWLELGYSARVAVFTLSGIACATLIFLGVLYMVVKGNPERDGTRQGASRS